MDATESSLAHEWLGSLVELVFDVAHYRADSVDAEVSHAVRVRPSPSGGVSLQERIPKRIRERRVEQN